MTPWMTSVGPKVLLAALTAAGCSGSDSADRDATLPLAEIAGDESRLRSIELRDGRALAWAEYGDPNGVPVLELHGGGASHLSGLVYHRDALAAGVRVIAVDRPGAGGSTADPAFAVATYHEDIRQLADHLDLGEFVVMGNSNGGMFSVALAHAMPDRVVGAIPMNPATPVFDDPAAWELTPIYHGLAEQEASDIVGGMRAAMLQFGENPEEARSSDPFRQFPEDTEPEIVAIYFAAIELTPAEVLEQEVQFILEKSGWGFDVFDIQPRVEFFTGLHEVGTPYNEVWVDKLPNAGLHLTTGGHAGQTAPETRKRIMRCVLALTDERACEPTPPPDGAD